MGRANTEAATMSSLEKTLILIAVGLVAGSLVSSNPVYLVLMAIFFVLIATAIR
jgi:hypothetical protein